MKTRNFIIVSTLVVAIAVACALPAFIRARNTPSSAACILHLMQIDGAKQQWALENSKTTNDVPTLNDLRPYMGRGPEGQVPRCPAGGTYSAGRVGEPPTCSIGGPSHTSPK